MKCNEIVFSDVVAFHNPKQGYSFSFASEKLSLVNVGKIVETVDTETVSVQR